MLAKKYLRFVGLFLLIIFSVLDGCKSKTQKKIVSETNLYTDEKEIKDKPEILQIYLKEFDIYFRPDSCNGDFLVKLLGNQGALKITMVDCRGSMKIKKINSLGKLVVEGSYINSIDTLKKYSIGRSVIDDSRTIQVLKFFQPLPDGEWIYFKNGKQERIEIYKNGILRPLGD